MVVDAVALILIPFVQIGLSFWASIASVVGAMVMVTIPGRLDLTAQAGSAWRLVVAALMMAPLLANIDTTMVEVLRVGREIVFFLLMTAMFSARSSASRDQMRTVERSAVAVLTAMTALVLVQIFYNFRAQYFGIPQDWFIANELTLPGELDLIYGAIYGYLRPTGTFGEPSYLGFICLSIGLAFLPLVSTSRNSRIIVGLVCAIALLARSASFLVALACVFGPFFLRKSVMSPGRFAALLLAVAVALFASDSIQETLTRLLSIGGENVDSSLSARLLGAAFIMPEYLTQHPFGVPFTKLEPALRAIVGVVIGPYGDNAVWGLFYVYGVLGPIVLFAVLQAAPDGMTRIYVFMCMQFNGLFFAMDKFAVMSICLGIYNRATSMAEADRARQSSGAVPSGFGVGAGVARA